MAVSAAAAAALVALAPVVVHDAQERSPLASVRASTVAVPGVAAASPAPTAYGRAVPVPDGGAWLQWWLFSADQDQDRGLVRSGRHQGDWELVMARVDPRGRPVEVVVSQHSSAERCGASVARRSGSRLVVFAAKGAHGLYLRPGTRDRLWPDPNDEADGRGPVVRPRVERLRSQPWLAWPGRWGRSRAAWWNPAESDSPRGPAFQPDRWDDPAAFARSARACQARCSRVDACDDLEAGLGRGALAALLAAPLLAWRRRRRRR